MKPVPWNRIIILLIIFGLIAAWGEPFSDWTEKKGLIIPFRSVFKLKEPTLTLPAEKKPITFKVPILLHHFVEDVTDEPDFLRKSMATRPYYFEDQLKALKNAGYSAVGFMELAEAYRGGKVLPEKSFVITFDDGHADLYTNALPLLIKYDFKAVIFVITGKVGQLDFLTVGQLKEMVKTGLIEIGSHTLSHEYLGVISKWARQEVFESKRWLEETLNVLVPGFAYPGGSKNGEIEALVREAGYGASAGIGVGVADEKSDPYDLPRLRIGNLTGAELLALIEKYEKAGE